MHDGTEFQVRGGNWFGLEGQDDVARPGAMELFIGAVSWAPASDRRTLADTMREIQSSGLAFNTIRLPIAPQTLVAGHPDGDYSRMSPKIRNNDPTAYPYANSYEALEDFIKQAAANNLYIILGVHSCSNHVGWRKGRLDDSPPWVDSDRPNYPHSQDNYTCASGEDAYDTDKWLANVHAMAALPKKLGVHNIIGIDCFNEPWKYKWNEWADLAKQCYDAIAAEDDDLIAVVEGVSASHELPDRSLEPEPFGDPALTPNWGENLYGQQSYAVQIPKDRVCFSPHTYGPSVFVQKHMVDQSNPACVGLEDDAAAAAGCGLVTTRNNATAVAQMRKGWDEHFGYLHDQHYCVIIGEFGGTKNWPSNELEPEAAQRWAHLPRDVRYDWEWQNIFVDYLKSKGMTDFFYWAINPESGDTGGLYNHAYTDANRSGWGTWRGLDTEKVEMLSGLR
jgi:endoglucanase